jgi:phosphate transport system permease protein
VSDPIAQTSKVGDRIFGGLSKGAGVLILVALAAVSLFLISEAWPAFTTDLTELDGGDTFLQYVLPLVFGTIWASFLALPFFAGPASTSGKR